MHVFIKKEGIMPTSERLPDDTENRDDDMEDVCLAEKRIEEMKRNDEKTIPLEKLMDQYGLF
jgi:hypothetical protein